MESGPSLVFSGPSEMGWKEKGPGDPFSVQERTVAVTTPSRVPVNLGKGETMRGDCPFEVEWDGLGLGLRSAFPVLRLKFSC